MNGLHNTLLLSIFLLLSQTAVLAHDVDHLENTHGEMCVVYTTQDHSANCDASVGDVSPVATQLPLTGFFSPARTVETHLAYSTRAPPKINSNC